MSATMSARVLLTTLIVLTLAPAASAQRSVSAEPRPFDVCSIKPSAEGAFSSWRSSPDGGFTAVAVPAVSLVGGAFGVEPFQVSGLPGWATSDRYDVACKDTDAANANDRQHQRLQSGLQALLSERFGFRHHRGEKQLPVATLRVGKHGLKLTPSKSSSPSGGYGPLRLKAEAWSIGQLASAITRLTGEKVVDQTGAEGRFDFDLEWKLEEQDPGAAAAPGAVARRQVLPDVLLLSRVLEERVGLTITRTMQRSEIIVVDRIEKPGAN